MGRFIREELQREGVSTAAVRTDPDRLTALVLLGIRDQVGFPLIFYRENCADMAISVDDIDEALIASTRAVVTSGTHFSTPGTKAASLRALELAAKHDAARIIDLDYRPVLWGLADKGDGETRFVSSQSVTSHLQEVLSHMDVVVGTEEEIPVPGRKPIPSKPCAPSAPCRRRPSWSSSAHKAAWSSKAPFPNASSRG